MYFNLLKSKHLEHLEETVETIYPMRKVFQDTLTGMEMPCLTSAAAPSKVMFSF